MNTLMTCLIISETSVIFVNILLFGFLRIPEKSIPFGSLFLIQLGVAFSHFLFIKLQKESKKCVSVFYLVKKAQEI